MNARESFEVVSELQGTAAAGNASVMGGTDT